MDGHQRHFQTFVGHPWRPFDQGNQGVAATYRPGQWEFEPWQREVSGSGQTLREVLEELQAPRVSEEAQWQHAQTTARPGTYRARNLAGALEAPSRGSGYESGMRRSHRTRGQKAPNYGQKRKITRSVRPRTRNTEEVANADIDVVESLAEASGTIQEERSSQAVEEAVEQAAQDVREGTSEATGERTEATAVDPMDLPVGVVPVAAVRRSLINLENSVSTDTGIAQTLAEGSGTARQEPKYEAATRRSQRIRDLESKVSQPEQYRQKTKITGVDPMDMLEDPRPSRQRTRVTGRDPLNAARNASHGDPMRRVERSAESVFYDALGDAERAEVFDPMTSMEQGEPRRRLADVLRRARHGNGENISARGASSSGRVRARTDGQQSEGETEERPSKRARTGANKGSTNRQEEVEATMRALEEEFEEKVRQSHGGVWCEPVPHERKVATVREFYKAFHDVRTLAVHTCTICYRKFAMAELEEFESDQSMLADLCVRHGAQFGCVECFASGRSVLGCAECVKNLERGVLSPAAHVHGRLRCEHAYPDALKDLTPVEEKLIALNSCYGFITKYNVVKGSRESATYPKHVKGHITVFPSSVHQLITHVLPHPLLKVMDEIHVSWQGAEKPAPKDLSLLLSVRRRVVERALVWLKRNNPHYAGIAINTAEMESWGSSPYGVPHQVYERLERDEPSAWEKTRTAQLVPQTERGLEPGSDVDVREILATLNEPQAARRDAIEKERTVAGSASGAPQDDANETREVVQEVSASGMFALDAVPDVQDAEKLQYVYDALGRTTGWVEGVHGEGRLVGSAHIRSGGLSEPYIVVSRGEEFADSHEAWFFAKTFPTLFPFGLGGPRQVEESISGMSADTPVPMPVSQEPLARGAVTSRNLSLKAWSRIVLQRHGGRFATHKVFTFLVFNMLVRYRNHQVSMMSVTRKDFPEVERVVQTLSARRLEKARAELEALGKTSDDGVNRLLRNLSLYGLRQPMSRELRLGMRRKIKSLIVREGIPAIWFTLNPNDVTNPVKLRLAAYRTRDPDEAEAFLTNLDSSYKRMRLAISDPLSSALFFHREISLFFRHYVKVGEDSVFGRISQYFGAVETNERGALHLHGLLWIHGNMFLSSLWKDVEGGVSSTYQDRVLRYVDSVFTEDLDQEAFCAVGAERTVTSDISSRLSNEEQFSASFEEEANFCAGATQIHTHSPTCVKYSINRPARTRNLCRFKAPWRLVQETAFKEGGVLEIRRNHSMVNRWNKAISVGLRHNHDISFIGTQSRTMAIVFYVTNYATKLEDPVWKRAAAAVELLEDPQGMATVDGPVNRTRVFLARVANRIFTERALSQVEVAANLLGLGMEFTHSKSWVFLNVSSLYWEIFRRWKHLRDGAGEHSGSLVDEAVILEHSGQRATFVQAYPHRGPCLAALPLYDYMSIVTIRRKRSGGNGRGVVEFDEAWPLSETWVQILRKSGEHATVCLDGYLGMDFAEDDERCYRRAAVQHLAMFVPWEHFLSESQGDANAIWERMTRLLPRRLAAIVRNIQLLRRSAEDAKRDARQWAAQSGEEDPAVDVMETATFDGEEHGSERARGLYRPGKIGTATCLIDVLRSAMGTSQITAGSKYVRSVVQQLCDFQLVTSDSPEDLRDTVMNELGGRIIRTLGGEPAEIDVPGQDKVRSIKSQQASMSRERERRIKGIQEQAYSNATIQDASVYRVLSGYGEDDISIGQPSAEPELSGPAASIRLGPSTSFSEVGRQVAQSLTLNRRQTIALRLLCHHLDRLHRGESNTPQLCQFVGGEGGTGKSRVIEAVIAVFARKGVLHRLLVTATSGTAAARINGITIHAACNVSVDTSRPAPSSAPAHSHSPSSSTRLRVDGQNRMDWQEKDVMIVDETSMLGARTLDVVNERLCDFRGCTQDFGGIPIILFLGDFKQFRPVQERSILIPSSEFAWDEGKTFKVEQRHQHDKAHRLWRRFTTVVILNEQVRAAGDPQLQRLLTRIRQGVADQSDVDMLNRTCYEEGKRIPWETGITVVTPLNRNRWNLNIEAALSFQAQHKAQLRIFVSEHKWKGGQPTEEEAIMVLGYGDDSSVPIPSIFMFVPGMPVVVNRNTYQGLKLVNGSNYTALDVIVDDAFPGHRVSENTILHFGPPAGIILAADSTRELNFVGMPPGTILLTPLSSKIECARRRPWQRHDVTRRGLPCTAAFACTDYKVQGRTLDRVALELRGTRTVQVNGQAVPSQCDFYSLYVQLSRSTSMQGIMLLSKVRERDIIGNTMPQNMIAAERRLEDCSEATIKEAEVWDWTSPTWQRDS